MTQSGPNDARRVVWAIGISFLFFVRVSHILMIISVIFRVYLSNKCTRSLAMTQTSPNNAPSGVVWAIGMPFLFFVCIFYILMIHLGCIYLINAQGVQR
jgi:uncharacterized membrane protein